MKLVDTEMDVPGITTGMIAEHLRVAGSLSDTGDLNVTSGWGHFGAKGRIYPGRGKITERTWTTGEQNALARGLAKAGLAPDRGLALLGHPIDIHLNATTCWQAVPSAVWNLYIGGYQVIKKWLSYRERGILGRDLHPEEAREVTHMIRRLTALILLGDALDANYAACRDNAWPWGAGTERQS